MNFRLHHDTLRIELENLYKCQLPTSSRIKKCNNGFLAVDCIERSIFLLASEVKGRLLDVGCGDQPYRKFFEDSCKSILACDYEASKPGIDFACPAHAIPQEDQSFDSILCTEVLEHVPDPAAALKEFCRLLAPRGKLLLTAPCYWPPHELPYDFFRYPSHGLIELMEANGFRIDRFLPRGGQWAFLGQVGSHVLNRHLARPPLQSIWNSVFQAIDRKRLNPSISLGWAVLASKLD